MKSIKQIKPKIKPYYKRIVVFQLTSSCCLIYNWVVNVISIKVSSYLTRYKSWFYSLSQVHA